MKTKILPVISLTLLSCGAVLVLFLSRGKPLNREPSPGTGIPTVSIATSAPPETTPPPETLPPQTSATAQTSQTAAETPLPSSTATEAPADTATTEASQSTAETSESIADASEIAAPTYSDSYPMSIGTQSAFDERGYSFVYKGGTIDRRLPEGITMSDTVGSILYCSDDSLDHFTNLYTHFDESGVYDGHLGLSYVWVTLYLDMTNNGDAEILTPYGMRLSFGEFSEALYCGVMTGRFERSQPPVYLNSHYFMPELGIAMKDQYYIIHFDAGETKQMVFCYPIEERFADEEMFLELNPHEGVDPGNINYLSVN